MKISITTNNKVFSVEDEFGFDCASIHDAVEMFKGLLVCAGFHPSNVDDAFNTEYTWFTEEERNDNMQGHLKNDKFNEGYAKGWDDALHNQKVEKFQDDLYKNIDGEHN
jgi:hypothetical protein